MQFILLLVVSYLGLLAGTILAHMAKEELLHGRRYFPYLKAIVFTAIVATLLVSIGVSILITCLVSAIIMVLFTYWTLKLSHSDQFAYALSGVSVFETRNATPLIPSLVFFYGIIAASAIYDTKRPFFRNLFEILAKYLIFVVSGVCLYLLIR